MPLRKRKQLVRLLGCHSAVSRLASSVETKHKTCTYQGSEDRTFTTEEVQKLLSTVTSAAVESNSNTIMFTKSTTSNKIMIGAPWSTDALSTPEKGLEEGRHQSGALPIFDTPEKLTGQACKTESTCNNSLMFARFESNLSELSTTIATMKSESKTREMQHQLEVTSLKLQHQQEVSNLKEVLDELRKWETFTVTWAVDNFAQKVGMARYTYDVTRLYSQEILVAGYMMRLELQLPGWKDSDRNVG